MLLKIIGTLIALGASILGIVSSFAFFAASSGVDLSTTNTAPVPGVIEHSPILGSAILIVAIVSLVLSVFAFKYRDNKKLFISLMVLGVVLILLQSAVAGSLLIVGGLMSLIGAFTQPALLTRKPTSMP